MFSVSTGGKTEKGASNTFQAYQASVSDAWDIEVSTQFSYLGEKNFMDWLILSLKIDMEFLISNLK